MGVKGWPPRHLTPVTRLQRQHGRGEEAIQFIETFCRVTKDSLGGNVGDLIVLRPWQKQLILNLLAADSSGRMKHRQALLGIARKNGKSALLSGLALWALVTGPGGGEVYAVAGSKEQAGIVFQTVRRMIELDLDLSDLLTVLKATIDMPSTGSTFKVMAAEAPQLEGLNPSFVIYDELHTANSRELWDVLALASGTRPEPMMVAITTAGVRTTPLGGPRIAYEMYNYGIRLAKEEVEDSDFFMAWWEPKDSSVGHSSMLAARQANPGLGDILAEEELVSARRKTPEPEFRTKRLNQWVPSKSPWLPTGAWDRRKEPWPALDSGSRIVLALDGSYKNDSTAVIACTVDTMNPFMWVVGLWEAGPDTPLDWTVDIQDVEDSIRRAARKYGVVEVACDPYRWSRTIDVLLDEGLPMVVFPQSPVRMVPATQRFFEAVVGDAITHDGDPRLARHIDNATLKVDSRGSRLAKETHGRKIDAAVTAVMALDRAAFHKHAPRPRSRTVHGFA